MYKIISETSVLKNGDTSIPFDHANTDYRQYLAWLSEGNTPEPADPVLNPRIAEIHQQLATIDSKSIRALRENNTVRIAEWDAQAAILRAELATL